MTAATVLQNCNIINARRAYIIPGLIDNHVYAAITTMNLRAVPNRPVTMMALETQHS